MTNDIVQSSYNKYTNLPDLPYNCISYLMQNNELIWKLLKYNDAKAYEKSDLTFTEKAALIYSGQDNASSFRVFMDVGADDSILGEITILRISVLELVPSNYVYGYVTMGMETYTHYKTNTLANYKTRLDTILQQLIETFNGAEITGLGRLYFDARATARSKTTIIGTIPYKGKALTMCNHMLG
jgi:hypothetical protein